VTPGEDHSLRLAAPLLQEACAGLLPGYGRARREPERMALLTAACLARGRPAASTPVPGIFEELARAVLTEGEPTDGTVLVTEAENPSDVLCALWLARLSGLFAPGSSTAEASGKRSCLEIVPCFAPRVGPVATSAAMASLYANAAFRRHLEARGRARMAALTAAAA
jgi:hypothetical protein